MESIASMFTGHWSLCSSDEYDSFSEIIFSHD